MSASGAYVLEASASQGGQAAPFRAKVRTAYQDFPTLLKDADSDTPILKNAAARLGLA